MTTLGLIFPPDQPPERLRPVAVAADEAGLDQLWLWEDCFKESGIATAAAVLAWTQRLVVGIGLLPVPLRNVALTAMELGRAQKLNSDGAIAQAELDNRKSLNDLLVAFAKSNEKLTIVGGSLGGEALDVAGVQALATLPSLDELRGKIIGLLQAPATKIAGVLVAPAGQVARVFAAYGAKEEAKAA